MATTVGERKTRRHLPEGTHSRTNILLDDDLIERARELSGLRTKREIVEEALRCFIRTKKQAQGVELFGKLPWDGDLQAIRAGRQYQVEE